MRPTFTPRSLLALAGSSLLAVSSASAGQIWDGENHPHFTPPMECGRVKA